MRQVIAVTEARRRKPLRYHCLRRTYDSGLPAAGSDYESGYLKRILAFIGITEVEVILAGGTAAVAFGSTKVEEPTAQFRPAVLAAIR